MNHKKSQHSRWMFALGVNGLHMAWLIFSTRLEMKSSRIMGPKLQFFFLRWVLVLDPSL